MRLILAIASIILLTNLTSCDDATKQTQSNVDSNFDYSGVIQEVIQTSNYTYCLLSQNKNKHWIAISRMDVKKDETLYYNQGLEMKNFHSKELDRTFPSVFFVQKASTNPNAAVVATAPQMGQKTTKPVKPKIVKKGDVIEKAAEGITIAELYANKAKYAGKKVKIRGKVTKFNTAIMNKNWAHIQDGSDYDGNFDLTVTTVETVNKDAVVTFEGIIAADKDFGSGYSYSIIMEEAHIIK